MWAAGAIAVAAVALLGGWAAAKPGDLRLVTPRGRSMPPPWQRWAEASLMPTVRGRVTVRLTGCPALPRAAGCIYNRRPRVIYIRRGVSRARSVLLHELGHLFDLRVMNNGDRGRFRRIFRQPRRRAWWKGGIPLAEQFAEAYSFCARCRRIVSIARFATYDYRPSRRQHEAVCKLIRDAAGDRAPSTPPADAPPVTRSDPVPPPQPPSSPGTVPNGPVPSPTPQTKPTPTPAPVPIPPLPTPPPLPV
jgi:hypothetical protein